MDSDSGDLLLMLVQGGTPLAGNAQTVLTVPGKPANPLVRGFVPGKIMEIDNFSLRIGTQGNEPGAETKGGTSSSSGGSFNRTGQDKAKKDKEDQDKRHDQDKKEFLGAIAKRGGYQSWRAGKAGVVYPLDIQPITFERSADMTSKQLIQSCIDCTSFDSATIIKRRPVGSDTAGEVYLRLDFTGVLIIKVDWGDEDEYIKESVSFIARGITMSYRPQTSSGSLGAIVPGFWSLVGEKQVTFGSGA